MGIFSVTTSFVEVIFVVSTDDIVVVVSSAAEYEAEALEPESAEMVGLAGSASAEVGRAPSMLAVCRSGAPVCHARAVTVVVSEGTRISRVEMDIEQTPDRLRRQGNNKKRWQGRSSLPLRDMKVRRS